MNPRPCRWFHHWHYVGTVDVPAHPECGSFNPHSKRTKRMDKFLCCHCGETKVKKEPEIYY